MLDGKVLRVEMLLMVPTSYSARYLGRNTEGKSLGRWRFLVVEGSTAGDAPSHLVSLAKDMPSVPARLGAHEAGTPRSNISPYNVNILLRITSTGRHR